MALVQCWECGGMLSDSAGQCPHCGAAQVDYLDTSVVFEKTLFGGGNLDSELDRLRDEFVGWRIVSVKLDPVRSMGTIFYYNVRLCKRKMAGRVVSPKTPVPSEKPEGAKPATPATPQAGAKGLPPAGTCKLGPLTMKAEGAGYTVTYCDRGAGSAEIPEECGGYPVLAIANGAFKAAGIRSVTIPDSVTVIGAYAFQDCRSLQKVSIGRGVKRIRFSAFKGCDLLRTVYYRGTDTSWGDVTIEDGNRELLSNQILLCE